MDKQPVTPDQLEQRLVAFGVAVCRSAGTRSRDFAIAHITSQLIRSATSPAANYSEAHAAQSRRDFAHKLQICLKELRETATWLRFINDLVGKSAERTTLGAECHELIAIFVASLKTIRRTDQG